MFVHYNGHKTKEMSNLKIVNFKKEYGSKKLAMKKYGNKVRDQIVWKRVRDGARGSLKNESK